ncbi:hypothetical protein F5148DRAFT_1333948 [Russula earlei]|uniref:Uncharacterized protein n=1 Tax=Russula earlei TaxID=71964 RepID=A0ACC0TW39_9AGAM|nr:hypothetical protein F5148DRAFT_1333948 [Russula earlei]
MRTSAVVAFICLAMGVAPSFSLPSISVRCAYFLKFYYTSFSFLFVVERIYPKDHSPPTVKALLSRIVVFPPGGFRPTSRPHVWETLLNGDVQTFVFPLDVTPPIRSPPNTNGNVHGRGPRPSTGTVTPSDEQRKANYVLNSGSDRNRERPSNVFADALKNKRHPTL